MTSRSQRVGTPMPPVLLSRWELERRGQRFLAPNAQSATALPIEDNGATFAMAQDVRWLDVDHFAVGRWDGSLDVFRFNAQQFAGPLIRTAVSSPSSIGVQMITRLSARTFITSNDSESMIVWHRSDDAMWTGLRPAARLTHDPVFGVATGGDTLTLGGMQYFVAGHSEGYLTIWARPLGTTNLQFMRPVDLRSANPCNPFGLQDIHDVYLVAVFGRTALVITGSENGEVCFVRLPDGEVVSRTVFNPGAKRGINSIAVRGRNLLVANCSVGEQDHNLWLFDIDIDAGQIHVRDRTDLKVNPARPQAFNFSVVWARYDGGTCWFSSTEEGALWMGTIDDAGRLSALGYQEVPTSLGSSLAFNAAGRLVMVGFNLHEFVTLTAPARMGSEDPEVV